MKPFFSVVIPTLNEENYLPKLLSDLSKQKEKYFEVIIVDAFSKDNTIKVSKKFQKKFNLKFYQIEHANVSIQRNYGAIKSLGKYIVFLDADVRLKSSFMKKLFKFIKKQKGLIFIPYLSSENGDREYKPLLDIFNLLIEFSQSINMKKKFSLGGSMVFEKNFFNMIGGFDTQLFMSEDHELIQKAFRWGVSPKFMRANKITLSLRRWKKEGNLKIIYKYFIVTAHRLFGGDVKNKIIEYKMGGEEYKKIIKLKTKKSILSRLDLNHK